MLFELTSNSANDLSFELLNRFLHHVRVPDHTGHVCCRHWSIQGRSALVDEESARLRLAGNTPWRHVGVDGSYVGIPGVSEPMTCRRESEDIGKRRELTKDLDD